MVYMHTNILWNLILLYCVGHSVYDPVLRRRLSAVFLLLQSTVVLVQRLRLIIKVSLQSILADTYTTELSSLLHYRLWCRCRLLFDFSDHIVLSMVQYMLPCVLEIHYVLYRRHSNNDNGKGNGNDICIDSCKNNKKDSYGEDSTSGRSSSSSAAPYNNAINAISTSGDQFSPVISSFLTILVSIIIMLGSFRSIVFTSMFFHTRLENLAAFIIVMLFVYLPIYSSRIVKIWVREILQ